MYRIIFIKDNTYNLPIIYIKFILKKLYNNSDYTLL